MQSKDYFKNKARKIAKQTWAGPGKFGVFIILCIIVIATFESLGLSNREKNLELRNVQNIVIPVHSNSDKFVIESDHLTETFHEKLKISTKIEFEKKNTEREKILLYGAIDQFYYENGYDINEEKNAILMTMILKNSQDVIANNDNFILDI